MKGWVSWDGGGGGQEAHWYGEPLLYVILITAAQNPCAFPERIEPQDLSYGRQVLKTEPFFRTPMLETVPVVWKVECPELGEAGEDAGQVLQGVVGQVQAPQVMQALKLIKNNELKVSYFCYVTVHTLYTTVQIFFNRFKRKLVWTDRM